MDSGDALVFHDGTNDFVGLRRLNKAAQGAEQLALGGFGAAAPNMFIERLLAALRGIEAHVGFETRASWVARSYQRTESLRGASTLFPAQRLELMGVNLANAWWELQSRASSRWDETMEIVRLGLGERVDKVIVTPDPGGGNVYLSVRFKDMAEPVVAANLSDGQLSWLGFVAMVRLNERRSLLAIDEPELHMHPALLGRVISLLTSAGAKAPVLISSHSDRVLELLDDPADALRVCSMEGSRAVLSRIDTEKLPLWLKQFGDLGQLRASGYLPRVLEATQKGDT
jgi:predicted ATPase